MSGESRETSRDSSTKMRLHPLVAWTAECHDLGTSPRELRHDGPAVVAVRLPEGWPVLFDGPPALVWQELAAAGEAGADILELAAPWVASGAARHEVLGGLEELLAGWCSAGLLAPVGSDSA
ncbi:hypothetical protein [Brachybacterium saurashtrense]|uniref:PqqD family protein n=1 Tax=Brachybacterium saurashtrense TaxID=556288 RepID=A0A345YNA8_9MICO|nr:hypothetical protein [Brachybacterium saurashtrense]AXK45410.1 hypothetical protein DWV08_07115 [Brachybacterium saurashtrense]RRR21833.1 hypothetical protein DXU92_10955 [Brachybacterium saurashtrense]